MSAFRQLSRIPKTYPFLFGVTISTFKTSFSDLLVQKVVEQKPQIDWKRNAAFASFGFFYLGGVQYALYVPVFGRLFPNAASFAAKSLKEKVKDPKGIMALLSQVFLDQCVHHPLMYFPVFYATKEMVMNPNPSISDAMAEYRENMMEDLKALWKVWVPATLMNFAFMPMYARIPTVAATSLVWTCILSAMRGGDVVHSDELAMGAVRGGSLVLMKEGLGELLSSPVEMDPSLTHFCLSAAGPDKVGWVSKVANAVASEGGNITHSKMVRLGHDFMILMHVAVPPQKLRTLIGSLKENEELRPLNIQTSFLTRRQTGKYEKAVMGFRIHCVGKDRPGMLAAIAEKVSDENLSVENITTELRTNRDGRRDFVIDCDCTASRAFGKEELEALFGDFEKLRDDIGFDIIDVRAHVDSIVK